MNWFTKSNAQGLSASKKAALAAESDCCEHVTKDPSVMAYVHYENDSFGREGHCLCSQCHEAIESKENEEVHTCRDCNCELPLKDGIMWKWYDFVASQGDEPTFVCNSCCKLANHLSRVDRDKRNYDDEFPSQDDGYFDCDVEDGSIKAFDDELTTEDEFIESIEKEFQEEQEKYNKEREEKQAQEEKEMKEQNELRKIFEEQEKLEREFEEKEKLAREEMEEKDEQEEKDIAVDLEEMRVFLEGGDKAAKNVQEHRNTLARFYRKVRSDKGLSILVPDIERISCAIENNHPVILVFSKSRGWLHPFHNSQEWSVWSCNPDGTGEYRLVDTP